MDDLSKEIVKQIPVKDLYDDTLKETAQHTGKLISVIPRAIHASLLPVEKWIANRSFELETTKKLLEKKLQYIDEANIVPPPAYIGVPALQAISYSFDCNEIRELFATLLANSMNSAEQSNVHPAFIEIIKQLTPDEAKIIKHLAVWGDRQPVMEIRRAINPKLKEEYRGSSAKIKEFGDKSIIATVLEDSTLRFTDAKRVTFSDDFGETFTRNIALLGFQADCDYPEKISNYIDNLTRLKIINVVNTSYLTVENEYYAIATSKFMLDTILLDFKRYTGEQTTSYKLKKGFICFSDFGKQFVDVCIDVDAATDSTQDEVRFSTPVKE